MQFMITFSAENESDETILLTNILWSLHNSGHKQESLGVVAGDWWRVLSEWLLAWMKDEDRK